MSIFHTCKFSWKRSEQTIFCDSFQSLLIQNLTMLVIECLRWKYLINWFNEITGLRLPFNHIAQVQTQTLDSRKIWNKFKSKKNYYQSDKFIVFPGVDCWLIKTVRLQLWNLMTRLDKFKMFGYKIRRKSKFRNKPKSWQWRIETV